MVLNLGPQFGYTSYAPRSRLDFYVDDEDTDEDTDDDEESSEDEESLMM